MSLYSWFVEVIENLLRVNTCPVGYIVWGRQTQSGGSVSNFFDVSVMKKIASYDKKNKNCITKTFSGGKLLGKYFSDQFASPCAEFILENWKKFNLNFSPFYEKKTLNYPRFELSTSVKKKNVPNVYFSFIFSSDNSGYIDKLKILLKKKSRIKLFKFFFRNLQTFNNF
jgi:hypothetical protein